MQELIRRWVPLDDAMQYRNEVPPRCRSACRLQALNAWLLPIHLRCLWFLNNYFITPSHQLKRSLLQMSDDAPQTTADAPAGRSRPKLNLKPRDPAVAAAIEAERQKQLAANVRHAWGEHGVGCSRATCLSCATVHARGRPTAARQREQGHRLVLRPTAAPSPQLLCQTRRGWPWGAAGAGCSAAAPLGVLHRGGDWGACRRPQPGPARR